MADLTITGSQVLPDTAGDIYRSALSAATITQGLSVYFDTATKTMKLYDADASLPDVGWIGVALTISSAGQPVAVQRTGTPTLGAGAAPAVGVVYITSDTAGGIRPIADVDPGDIMSVMGVGATGNKLKMPTAGVFQSGETTV